MRTIEIHEPETEAIEPAVQNTAPAPPLNESVIRPPLAQRTLFSDSLLEFGLQKKRHFLATATSFLVNALILGSLLLLPLAFTEELPKTQLLTFLAVPPPPPPPPPPAAAPVQRIVRVVQTDVLNTGQLRTPSRIPQKIQMIKEEETPPPMAAASGVVGGVPGGLPGGQMGGVIGGIVSSTSNLSAMPKLVVATPHRVRMSQGVTSGLLIRRIQPVYPPVARIARIQGEVVLKAIINVNGEIENLQLVTGHPMLVPAALAAVRQWRYKPYLLNGQPVEVETSITVTFVLS